MCSKPVKINSNAATGAFGCGNWFRTPEIGVSVADTVPDSFIGQVWFQNSVVDEIDCRNPTELNFGGIHVDMTNGGIASRVHVSGGVTALDNGKQGENIGGYRHDMSVQYVPEGTQVANRFGEIEMGHNANGNPVGESFEQGISVMENSSLLDGDIICSVLQKSEEAIIDGLGNGAMEVHGQSETNNIKQKDVASDAFNDAYMDDIFGVLDPYVNTKGNMSSDLQANHSTAKPGFCVSDLVWGKVRSHPWWPGQILNPNAASKMAKKYAEGDSYLIAYFGDRKFAWNHLSKIKHFREHFPLMEKQSSAENFLRAVACALEEFSRRVEFGLACSCIPEETYAKIKKQIIVNDGIKDESGTIDGGDCFSHVASFNSVKLIGGIKALAISPHHSGVERLEFVTVKAQLSAFYRWKGYLKLCEFNVLGGLLETDAGPLLLSAMTNDTKNLGLDLSSGLERSKYQDSSYHEQKSIRDSNRLRKISEKVSRFLAESLMNMLNGGKKPECRGDMLTLSSSGKNCKAVDSRSGEAVVKHKKSKSFSDDVSVKCKKSDLEILSSTRKKRKAIDSRSCKVVVKHKKSKSISDHVSVKCKKSDLSLEYTDTSLPNKQEFGIGNSMPNIANQPNASSSILEYCNESSCITATTKNKEKLKLPFSRGTKSFPSQESSLVDLFSLLRLAARDPVKQISSISLVEFFSGFRNFVTTDKRSLEDMAVDETMEVETKSEANGTHGLKIVNYSNWTNGISEKIPEVPPSLESTNETPSQKEFLPSETQLAVRSSAGSKAGLETACHNVDVNMEPVGSTGGDSSEFPFLTVLALKFRNLESVPSKENLNSILGHFGPLYEPKTEILKNNRAQVVFIRREDAVSACSSVRDYSVFGPSLLSYRLRFMAVPKKPSSRGGKRSKKLIGAVQGMQPNL